MTRKRRRLWILVACGSAVALYSLLGPRGRGTPDAMQPAMAHPSGLAPAAATAAPALPSDPDVRCMAAYLVAAGNAKDDPSVSADDRAGIQSIVMYFFGKLDGRRPNADLKADILKIVESPTYAQILRPDIVLVDWATIEQPEKQSQ